MCFKVSFERNWSKEANFISGNLNNERIAILSEKMHTILVEKKKKKTTNPSLSSFIIILQWKFLNLYHFGSQ